MHKRFWNYLWFTVVIMIVFVLFSCSSYHIKSGASEGNISELEGAVIIQPNMKDTNAEILATNLPEYDVSVIFGVNFGKAIASTDLSTFVKLIKNDTSENLEIQVYLSDDKKTLFIKPIFRFIPGSSEVITNGLKPGYAYRIVVSRYLKFLDGSILGYDYFYDFKTKDLDYGIYWCASDGRAEKFIAGRKNSYFDPTKPSVIYIHGWQKDTTLRDYFREYPYFIITSSVKNVDTGRFWINKGFNIGVFFWNQFADESEVKDAEAKIWFYNNGYKNMRYRLYDGSYKDFALPKSVGDLAFEEFVKNFSNYNGSEIRIVGHSLGNQLATLLTYKVHQAIKSGQLPQNVMPKRLVLLDPFWSKYGKSYLGGKTTSEISSNYVREMIEQRGLAVEMYKSSMLGGYLVGDENAAMKSIVAFYRLWPDFIALNPVEQHGYAVVWYFWSMAGLVNGYGYKFGAATSADSVKAMMNWDWSKNLPLSKDKLKMWYTEGDGNKTPTPLDDYFVLKSGVSTWNDEIDTNY
jgi:hypothetical protein